MALRRARWQKALDLEKERVTTELESSRSLALGLERQVQEYERIEGLRLQDMEQAQEALVGAEAALAAVVVRRQRPEGQQVSGSGSPGERFSLDGLLDGLFGPGGGGGGGMQDSEGDGGGGSDALHCGADENTLAEAADLARSTFSDAEAQHLEAVQSTRSGASRLSAQRHELQGLEMQLARLPPCVPSEDEYEEALKRVQAAFRGSAADISPHHAKHLFESEIENAKNPWILPTPQQMLRTSSVPSKQEANVLRRSRVLTLG